MNKKFIYLIIFILIVVGCGKKGPLKPPIINIPGVKEASFSITDDRILINAIMDQDVNFFKIERIELDSSQRPISQKIIYEGIENKVFFIDKNLDKEKNYQYKITPYLKNKKIGKVYISNPITLKIISPPYNLKGEILETKGTITLYFDGDHCESFKIYRYKKDEKKPINALVNIKEKYFVDEAPIYGVDMVYEVSCVVKGQESVDNPTFNIQLK